jgi:hypothetical protein
MKPLDIRRGLRGTTTTNNTGGNENGQRKSLFILGRVCYLPDLAVLLGKNEGEGEEKGLVLTWASSHNSCRKETEN